MSHPGTLTPRRFLEHFFGPGNDLDSGSSPDVAQALQPWISRVKMRKHRILLPRKQGEMLTWYAMADSAREARAFREELLAAVGPSFSGFTGIGAELKRSDQVEKAILDFMGPHAFRLRVVDPALKDDCRLALERMLALHDRRPANQVRPPRVVALVLRDFTLALQHRDREEAEAALQELRDGGYLDGQNLLYLDVRCWEAFADWPSILKQMHEGHILDLRRPARVTQALLRALYHSELATFEEGMRVQGALKHFQKDVWQQYATLLQAREGMPAPEVAKLFMLKAVLTRDTRLRDVLLEGSAVQGADKVILQAMATLVRAPESPPRAPQDEAIEAYLDGDKDRSFELLLAGGGGKRRIDLLLRCAVELGTLRVVELALEEVKKLGSLERKALEEDPRLTQRLDELEERYTAPSIGVPTGWLDWVQMVSDGAFDDNKAAELAQRGAEEWSLAKLVERPGDVVALAEAMQGVGESGKRQLWLALPHLQGFLLSEEELSPALKPSLQALLELYSLEESFSTGSRRAATDLLEALLRAGISDVEYEEAIELLVVLLGDTMPHEQVDEALDLLELLVMLAPGRGPTVRVAAWVHGGLQRWQKRLERKQVELFNQLGDELTTGAVLPLPKVEPTDEEECPFDWLTDRMVALYSMNESASTRVKQTLEEEVQGVQVLCFSDKVGGNPALKQAALTADVFLIVTGAATHSATGFIDNNLGTEVEILRSHAKGSSSMLRLLERP